MSNDNGNDTKIDKKVERTLDVICEENILFTQLNLKESTLKGLSLHGFKFPSPIQTKAIPMGLLGLDLIIQAKSGTGKTCVFSVLALECIKISSKVAQVLIISPTREIAFQSMNVIKSIGSFMENLNCQLFIGGIKVHEDLKKLKHCHIIVGTPGRIKYLIEENHIQTDFIRLLILDEADMLFTDNFQNAMNYIYNSLPMNKQMLTLSATYTDQMIDTIVTYMNSPVMIRLSNNEKATLLGIKHYYKEIFEDLSPLQIFWSKTDVLLDILSSVDFQQCIVFSNYQSTAQDLCDALESRGWSSAYISGNLEQKQRIDIYNKLKNFHCRVLITTDLTSRGIDAENVNLVINLGIPWEFETYLHRMGRAGRYGSYGVVISIVTKEELLLLDNIKEKCCINVQPLPSQIPCDLLENRVHANTEDIVVQKLNKNDQSSSIYELFRVYENYKSETDAGSVTLSDIVEQKLSRTGKPCDFNEIFHKYQTKIIDGDECRISPPIEGHFNPGLYQIIEQHLCTQAKPNDLTEQPKPTANVIETTQLAEPENAKELSTDLFELEAELGRLSSWAHFYSQQFQNCDDKITKKTDELYKLLNLTVS